MSPKEDLLGSPMLSANDSPPTQSPQLTNDLRELDMTSVLTPNEERLPLKKDPKSYKMSESRQAGSGYNSQQPFNNNYSTPPPTGNYTPNFAAPPFVPQHQQNFARPRGNSSFMGNNNIVPLSSIVPGTVQPTETQLEYAYAYAIRRPDGTITRLLPADTLPPLDNVNPHQGPEGVILLPPPRQHSPRRRNHEIMVPHEVVNTLHYESMGFGMRDTQSHIDSIIAQSTFSPPPQRREKIYCDKWIHEGVCAFTQMGCKYKHEMPSDKATQMSLGLNHGYPSWYRRTFTVGNNLSSPATEHQLQSLGSPTSATRINGPWRQLESGQGSNGNGSSSSFGAIGTPVSGNFPFNRRESMQAGRAQTVEEEDEDVGYNPRGRANTKT